MGVSEDLPDGGAGAGSHVEVARSAQLVVGVAGFLAAGGPVGEGKGS